MNELPTGQVIHRERGSVRRELRQLLGLASNFHPQTELRNTLQIASTSRLTNGR